jgi:hypothetical protein
MLGHSSTTITGSLYSHLLRSTGERVARSIANAVPRADAGLRQLPDGQDAHLDEAV